MTTFFFTILRFLRAFVRSLKDPEFRALFVLVLLLVGSGTVFYRSVEGWSIVDSIYFTIVTLTTIGYGDLHPTTAISKLFTVVYVLMGVGVFVAFVSKLAAHEMKKRE